MSEWPTIKFCGAGSERKPDCGRWYCSHEGLIAGFLPIPPGEYALIPKTRVKNPNDDEWFYTCATHDLPWGHGGTDASCRGQLHLEVGEYVLIPKDNVLWEVDDE